jgi:hypothetical protein
VKVRDKIWVGVDVGKAAHHACAVDADGKVVFSKPVPNGQAAIEALIAHAEAVGRQVMWALDLTSGVAGLLLALLLDGQREVRYVPGRLVNRMAGAFAGEGKCQRSLAVGSVADCTDQNLVAASTSRNLLDGLVRRIGVGAEDHTEHEAEASVGSIARLGVAERRPAQHLRGAAHRAALLAVANCLGHLKPSSVSSFRARSGGTPEAKQVSLRGQFTRAEGLTGSYVLHGFVERPRRDPGRHRHQILHGVAPWRFADPPAAPRGCAIGVCHIYRVD